MWLIFARQRNKQSRINNFPVFFLSFYPRLCLTLLARFSGSLAELRSMRKKSIENKIEIRKKYEKSAGFLFMAPVFDHDDGKSVRFWFARCVVRHMIAGWLASKSQHNDCYCSAWSMAIVVIIVDYVMTGKIEIGARKWQENRNFKCFVYPFSPICVKWSSRMMVRRKTFRFAKISIDASASAPASRSANSCGGCHVSECMEFVAATQRWSDCGRSYKWFDEFVKCVWNKTETVFIHLNKLSREFQDHTILRTNRCTSIFGNAMNIHDKR